LEPEDEIAELKKELADLEWASCTYETRMRDKIDKKNKEEYREKKKQFNDPFEIDQFAAMKHRSFERDRYGDNVRKEHKYPLSNFPVVRQLSGPDPNIFVEYMVRKYEEIGDDVKFYLEESTNPQNKRELLLSWKEGVELLHRRCFNVTE
jgi:hypothetical protein